VSSELVPLQSEIWQVRRRLAFLLDDLLGRPSGLRGKRQRARLQQMLIHDKYSDLTRAEAAKLVPKGVIWLLRRWLFTG